ncbi:MAG: ABC transporter permease [Bacteroidales bacterium]|nr:ABC transporter permease [Bacteroidales bacterium]
MERFVARRFLPRRKEALSTPIITLAVVSIALGVLVMVMALAILTGFQGEIRSRVVGFGSHLIVSGLEPGVGYDELPIDTDREVFRTIAATEGVKHLQFYAEKGGMIKTGQEIHGVILKGVDAGYDTTFFSSVLQQGRLPYLADTLPSNEVIVSRNVADKLSVAVGDKLPTYFFQDGSYRARAFRIVGVYSTDMNEFDDHYIIGDLRQVQRLNDWQPTQAQGCEITITDFGKLPEMAQTIYNTLDYDLNLETIVDLQPALFAWLNLLDSNIVLILVIMAIVCMVAVVSTLLILIFEKTQTIGILKTLGCTNKSVRRIFLIKAAGIIIKGILIGMAVALVLSLLQSTLHIIHLDPASYSMSYVPVEINPLHYLFVGVSTFALCLLSLMLPATSISKIQPAKTIRVE